MKHTKMTQTRRTFISTAVLLASGIAFSLQFAGSAAEKTITVIAEAGKTLREYMKDRISGIYEREKAMPHRTSRENPEIRRLYADFLIRPMSPLAEKYLHRNMKDRSAALHTLTRKGLYPYTRLKDFAATYPFELKE